MGVGLHVGLICTPSRCHAPRGNGFPDALRPALRRGASREGRSYAERRNEKLNIFVYNYLEYAQFCEIISSWLVQTEAL